MGFLDKMKNLFTDEVEEEPIKSEMIQVEIPAPAKVVEENISDSEVLKQEEKPTAPIFFDDAYFKELEKPSPAPQPVKSSYLKEKPKEEKKIFRPTPIISPVYGVLDKNYSKEDIRSKKNTISIHHESDTTITIDDVRKKAFGTLEDELETTLFGNNSILFNDVADKDEEEEMDLFDELIDEPTNIDEEIEIEDVPINIVEEEMDNPSKTSHTKKEAIDESELFDLIDSMYEKGE